MIVNDKDLIFNIKTLVVLPKLEEDSLSIFEHNFNYVYLLDNTAVSTQNLIKFINENNIQEVVLVNYRNEYESIIDNSPKEVEFDELFTVDLASLCVDMYREYHDKLIELYNSDKIRKFGVLDPNLYSLMNGTIKRLYQLYLDFPKYKTKMENVEGVGLINKSFDEKNSFYNELSAVSMIDNVANIYNETPLTKELVKEFNVNTKNFDTLDDVISNSEVNLQINFCNSDIIKFFKSMDIKTPCIIGNNYILKDDKELADLVQVKSDDDINEIAKKIDEVKNNKDLIFGLYADFRKEYSEKAKKSIEKFGCNKEKAEEDEEYEKLLTIGIPVYNVEEYVDESIRSVVDAVDGDEDTEILIVNDGSTDNSEEVVLKYVEKYPNLIRYIKQENHGLGNVRNVIMRESKAKYIASIDSDDTINKNFFKEAKQYLLNDVDVVICDWLSMPTGEDNYDTPALDEMYKFDNRFKKIYYCTIMPSNCNKIFKKKLYQDIGLEFVENLKFEDFGTNPVILNNLETIKYINKPYYEYKIRENSIMRTSAGYDMVDIIKILDERIEKLADKVKLNKKEFVAYVYAWRAEELIINQLYGLEESERNEMIDYIYNNLKGIINEIFDNDYYNSLVDRVDEPTKEFIYKRNEALIKGELKEFIAKSVKEDNYKILTPALLLYNIDNRK